VSRTISTTGSTESTPLIICKLSAIPTIPLLALPYRYMFQGEGEDVYYLGGSPSLVELKPPVLFYPLDSLAGGQNMGKTNQVNSLNFNSPANFTCPFTSTTTNSIINFLNIPTASPTLNYQIFLNSTISINMVPGGSISLWFKTTSDTTRGPLLEFYSSINHSSLILSLWYQLFGNGFHFIIQFLQTNVVVIPSNFKNFTPNTWNHIVAAFNTTVLTLYGNGTWLMDQPITSNVSNTSVQSLGYDGLLGLRKLPGNVLDNIQFVGCLGNVVVFDRFLSSDEVRVLYQWMWND
jgi:hypothetical protein